MSAIMLPSELSLTDLDAIDTCLLALDLDGELAIWRDWALELTKDLRSDDTSPPNRRLYCIMLARNLAYLGLEPYRWDASLHPSGDMQ